MKNSRIQGGWNKNPEKKFSSSKATSNLKFECPLKAIITKPEDIIINKSGTYNISNSSKGVSILELYKDFYNYDDACQIFQTLYKEIKWEQKYDYLPDGKKGMQPRLIAWFGDMSYSYSGVTHKPYHIWHPLLVEIKNKLENSPPCSAQTPPIKFNSVLANLYRNEYDGVDWHADDEPELGTNPYIASLSFGEIRTFCLRKVAENGTDFTNSQEIKIPLDHGSLIIMKGATQCDWQHKVPKDYHNRGPRINLTYRYTYDLSK